MVEHYKDFLKRHTTALFEWLESTMTKEGYIPPMNTEEILSFIDKCVFWYEFKYPDRDYQLDSINDNPSFSYSQFIHRLNTKEVRLLNGGYRLWYQDIYTLRNLTKEQITRVLITYKYDIKLRKKILDLAALYILYSKNTTLDRGYDRADRFINDFNNNIPNLNISGFISDTEKTTSHLN